MKKREKAMSSEKELKDMNLEIIDLNRFDESEEDAPVMEQKENPVEEEALEDLEEESFWKGKELLSWVLTFVVAFVLALVLKNYVIINASVPTGSMENTIQPKDKIFGFRLAYLLDGPERGDVIFFYNPDDETEKYVKRVIGLPGEKVTIIDGLVYINDSKTPLEETYLKEEWIKGTGPYEFNVPEDAYFCMGDNRNFSHDARYWVNTYVTKDKIIGKALYIYSPFEHMGVVE